MSLKYRLLCGAALCAIATSPAGAQTTTQINQLQQQIQMLQQQLQSLQNQVNAQAQQQAAPAPAPAATAAAAPAPHVTQTPGNRFGIESADGQYSIALTGRLHLDIGGYPGYHPDSHAASVGLNDLNSGVNARRARLGVTGKFAGDWNYTFIYDFGGSNDSGPAVSGVTDNQTGGIENAYVTYNGLYHGPLPLAFDVGYQDVPFTLDEATSSNDIMFMERSSSQVIATGFNFGDFRSAAGIRSNDSRYWAGLYVTGPASGASHTTGQPLSAFGRFTYQLLQTADYSLHVGADLGGMFKPALTTVGAERTFVDSDRPELRVDSTGPSTANPFLDLSVGSTAGASRPVSGGSVFGIETAGGYENLYFQGEGFNYRIDRDGLPTSTFWGGYMEGSVTLTGEHRNYIPATGAYSGIIPARPFSISAGTWGAFELALRLSYVNLNDNFSGLNGTSTTSNSIEGGRQIAYGLGINWYLNPNMRLMADYEHVVLKKSATTGELGADIDEVGGRVQIAF